MTKDVNFVCNTVSSFLLITDRGSATADHQGDVPARVEEGRQCLQLPRGRKVRSYGL